jgi:hypothetical protein
MAALYGKTLVERKFRLPPPGDPPDQVAVESVLDQPAAEAAKIAQEKGLKIRRQEAMGTPGALVSMIAAPAVNAGDTVDLVTDANGHVVGWTKVAPEAAPPSADVAALRAELARVTEAHATMQKRLEELEKKFPIPP